MQIDLPRFLCSAIITVVCLLGLATAASAQGSEPPDTIRIDSDLVNLQVSVLGQDPLKPPNFLQQHDFVVIDDGIPQEITFFGAADAPFDLVLLLDLSGSTANKLKMIRKSAKRFVEACRPTDRIAVIAFAEDLDVVSDLTSDHKKLVHDIDDIERLSDGTNFWDALRFVLEKIVSQSSRRTAIVMMTDGVDNALPDVAGPGSATTFDELVSVAKHSDALSFPVYLDTEREEVQKRHTPASAYASAKIQLAELAEISGTTVRKASKLEDLETIYQQIIRDLGTVYSIGYRPANIARDGKWHPVSVSLVARPELTARTKSGYYAGGLAAATPK
jgi:Ca-activated chloride channel family protein